MYHDAAMARLASIQPYDAPGRSMISRILGAVINEVSAEQVRQKRLANQRAVRREIAGLPARLRYDLAFTDLPFENDRNM